MPHHAESLSNTRPGGQRRGRKAVLLASVAALAVTGCGGSEGTAEQAEGQSAAGQQEEHGGEQIAEHMLGHDHADEQPFTRSQRGVEVPEDVREVQIEPKDLKNGYGGKKVTVQLPS